MEPYICLDTYERKYARGCRTDARSRYNGRMTEPSPAVQRFVERLDQRRSSLAAELEETLVLARGLTPGERDRDLVAVVRAGWEILMSRPDAEKVLAWQDPPAADFPELWRRLVERQRASTPATMSTDE